MRGAVESREKIWRSPSSLAHAHAPTFGRDRRSRQPQADAQLVDGGEFVFKCALKFVEAVAPVAAEVSAAPSHQQVHYSGCPPRKIGFAQKRPMPAVGRDLPLAAAATSATTTISIYLLLTSVGLRLSICF